MSVQVMVNGIPGNMGRIVAETCVARGLELVPYSLTGEIIVENEAEVAGKTVQLLKPSNREERIGEALPQARDDGELRAEMAGVDDVQTELDGVLRIVVAHVARHIGIGAERGRTADELRAASRAERDLAHGARPGIDIAHMRRRQSFPHLRGKVRNRHRRRQRSDAAEACGPAVLVLLLDDEA